ncbi:hypothetical protein [Proteus mirabilis]|uniref:hypothetical protein n=1 Tax=Proteus mirabilis TaxID=584 RepID=UPI0029C0CB32|nr:hypothetical protein [Proteus mirabilis]MDX4948887.1 hypothetical protein [Proteus mirabilis]
MGDYNSLFKQHTECNIHTITLIRDSILASSQKLQEKLALLEEMEHLFNDMLINAESLVVFLMKLMSILLIAMKKLRILLSG